VLTYAQAVAAGITIYGAGVDIGAYEKKKHIFEPFSFIPKKCSSTNAACYVQE
jgi:hypothetical protein